MYVYNAGIIEFFNGMIPLRDYIFLMDKYKNDPIQFDNFYLTEKELQSFLTKAFMSVFLYGEVWHGDISDGNIAISAIPRGGENRPFKLLAFRQRDCGTSFLVSEMLLDSYKDNGYLKEKLDHTIDVMKAFELSLDLTNDLLGKYAVHQKTTVIHTLKEIDNRLQYETTRAPSPSIQPNQMQTSDNFLQDFVRL